MQKIRKKSRGEGWEIDAFILFWLHQMMVKFDYTAGTCYNGSADNAAKTKITSSEKDMV